MTIARHPPGPKSLLPAGCYFALHRDVLGFSTKIAREHGDIVHMQLGSREDYLLNHPDHIRDVLLAPVDEMARSTPRALKQLLGKGLLTSEGELHRCQRRLLQPAFQKQRTAACGDVMTEYAMSASERWQDGSTADIAEEMLRLTMAIVVKTLFGSDIEAEADEMAEVLKTITAMTHKKTIPLLDEALAKLPLPSVRRFQKASECLDEMIRKMIRERRARDTEQSDFLSMLLQLQKTEDGGGLSDDQVRDEVITMYIAGHETIGNGLAWSWYLLSENPAVEKKLHEELDSALGGRAPVFGDLSRLPYTRMVLAESMRLYPPVWLVVRRALKDVEIGGYVIGAGSYLHMSQYLTHHDSRYFPEPQRFDPLRWTSDATATRPKFSYFPFGGGQHQCIGEGFAWAEGILIIATIAQRWRMRLVAGHRIELEPLITLRSKYGMPMVLERRK